MKSRIKSITCILLAGLIILISNCNRQPLQLRLINTKEYNFPSASGIEFYRNRLYVFGDDAPYLLVLTPDYVFADSVYVQPFHDGRIPKDRKHDIESALIRTENNQPVLYGIGSMSAENRWQTVVYSLQEPSVRQIRLFDSTDTFPSIPELNVEGSCMVGNTMVLSNRANLSSVQNHLIILEPNKTPRTLPMDLPKQQTVAGVSGLTYVKEKDLLLLTASEEETSSAILDGTIGDSYLGWVSNFSEKMQQPQIAPDTVIRLRDIDPLFTTQKIESVCVEKVDGNRLIIHLAADNDNGSSRFFKLELRLNNR